MAQPRRRPRGSNRGRSPRQPTTWQQELVGSALGPNAIALGELSLRGQTGATLAVLAGTLLRMVGTLTVIPNAAGSGQFGAGVSVMTQEALGLGASAAPLPLTANNRQGFYWWMAETSAFESANQQLTFKFDIRSARRIRSGFTLGLLFESATYSGLTILTINFQARLLWKPE